MVVLGGGAVSYERGTPAGISVHALRAPVRMPSANLTSAGCRGSRISDFGIRFAGFEFRISVFCFRVSVFCFLFSVFGLRISVLGFRVSEPRTERVEPASVEKVPHCLQGPSTYGPAQK